MKFTKNFFMTLGLLLQVGVSFAAISQGRAILERIDREEGSIDYSVWERCGPTREDILAATKVENLATEGSLEDKLISAVKRGDLKKVEALIPLGPDLEARDNGNFTALMIVAKNGFTDIASRLINAGALVDAMDRYNGTALFHAVDGGHAEIVELLIANGAAENQKNLKELFVSATFKGNNEVLKALLVEGSRLDQDTLEGLVLYTRSSKIKNTIKEFLMKRKHNS